jgi:hypothetical protein
MIRQAKPWIRQLRVAALEDRGRVVVFEPTALEVHRQAAGWYWDQETAREKN